MKHEEQEIHYRVCQSGNTTEDSRKNKQTRTSKIISPFLKQKQKQKQKKPHASFDPCSQWKGKKKKKFC